MINMDEWENMLHFAIEMIKHAKKAYAPDVIDERIAIVSLDHATELLMKSFLLENSYIINELNLNKIKKGFNKNTQLKDLLNDDKTIGFKDVLNIVSKKIELDKSDKETILKFHKLRNEIQHRGLYINLNKTEAIRNFCPSLNKLYNKMFPKYADDFPDLIFQ